MAGDAPDLSKFKFAPMKQATAAPLKQLPKHEGWRRQYHEQPYLRPLSDAELLAKGADILRRLMPHFIKGGPGYVPKVVDPSMEEFTHFIEEMNHRGIDMRRVPKQ